MFALGRSCGVDGFVYSDNELNCVCTSTHCSVFLTKESWIYKIYIFYSRISAISITESRSGGIIINIQPKLIFVDNRYSVQPRFLLGYNTTKASSIESKIRAAQTLSYMTNGYTRGEISYTKDLSIYQSQGFITAV